MIDLEIALYIHDKSIEAYGGGRGIRDERALLAAIARPFQTFDQQELYSSPVERPQQFLKALLLITLLLMEINEQHTFY